MKKFLAILLAIAMVACLFAGCAEGEADPTDAPVVTDAPVETDAPSEAPTEEEPAADYSAWHVAMITDYGDITDQSFNQTTYEAGKAWCEERGVDFTYYKPTGDSTAERVAMVDQAVAEGYNVLLMPGFAFADTVKETAELYPDVYYIVLDVGAGDYGDYVLPANVYSAVYQEQLPGYMAGYAAVKLGYKHLGYMGGMAVPAVVRYGFGYVQGANAAAVELGIEDEVVVEYAYGNQFFGDPDITAYMDAMYQEKGIEICFACGGSINSSVCEAAQKVEGAKVIGVDVDQALTQDPVYGEGITVTSAMKGLAATVKSALSDLIENDLWADYAGQIASLGIISGDDLDANYVGIAPSTQFEDGKFTEDDYAALVAAMYAGDIVVSDAIDVEPEVAITVNYLGNVK
ncbi:MAG: BMP family ABC transporter substrate-binding protein [Clostridiales bacterium]|nr:BMP family ABC transporter substrate-binding protein [Clostridiales bacterium]